MRTSPALRAGAARRPARLSVGLVVGLACAVGGWSVGPARAQSPPGHVASAQSLARVRFAHQAHRDPRMDSRVIASVPVHTPITGEATTLPVIGEAGPTARRWLRVRLPGRPDGLTGWIRAAGTERSVTSWHLVVSISRRRLWVYRGGRPRRSLAVVVGKPSTPTPTGQFFVQETVIMPATQPGGPFALALSARSHTLRRFDGGPGQIAIHGRDLLGGTLGTAQSHGCVRLGTPAITWLARRIGPGVPVTIRQ